MFLITIKLIIMKNTLFVIAAFLVAIAGCTPDKVEELGINANRAEQIPGAYRLTGVVQSDVRAVKNNYPFKSLDITNSFPFTEFELTLNVNGSTPSTFTTKKGNSPVVVPYESGTWRLDNMDAPKLLYLIRNTDTVKMEIANYRGLVEGKLNIRRVRYLDGKAVTNYDYEFTKK